MAAREAGEFRVARDQCGERGKDREGIGQDPVRKQSRTSKPEQLEGRDRRSMNKLEGGRRAKSVTTSASDEQSSPWGGEAVSRLYAAAGGR